MPGLLAPWSLVLLGLIAVPLAVHLLTRRQTVTRTFPAVALLARADGGRAARRRLRERAVLALRMLALALGAFAVAGVVWRGSWSGPGARPAVIVLDASASMRQIAGGSAVFDRARAAAGDLLAASPGRRLSLLVAGTTLVSSGAPSAAHGALQAMLAESAAGAGDGDPRGALTAAAALLPEGGDCFFVTDLARSSLAGVDPAALPARLSLHLVDAGGGGPNVGITGLSCAPAVAVAGRPVTVSARIANNAPSPAHLQVDLRLGSQARLLPIDLEPGAVGSVQMTATFDAAGAVAVAASLARNGNAVGGDALPLDDQRDGVLEILPAIATVLASDGDRDDPAGVARPLLAALAAAGLPARATDRAGLAADGLAHPGGATPALLITAGLRPGVDLARDLHDFLDAGGAWLQVIAGTGDADLAADGDQPPMACGTPCDVSEQERGSMALGQARLDDPLLEPFAGHAALLSAVSAYRYRLTPTGAAADATVLWTYADGTIALAERPVGHGRWLRLNCSPAAVDSTLAAGETLPLLIARLPSAVLPARNEHLAYDAGTLVAVSGAVTGPDGRTLDAQRDAAGVLHVRLDRPGLYRVAGGGLLAAAPPALESDLRRLDPTTLHLVSADASSATAEAATTMLWPWLIAALAVVLCGELALAGGITTSRRTPTGISTNITAGRQP